MFTDVIFHQNGIFHQVKNFLFFAVVILRGPLPITTLQLITVLRVQMKKFPFWDIFDPHD
jgi:hypothetical protein